MESRQDNGPYNIFAEAEVTVEFFQCDPLRIVWHGNYINYFEVGRRLLLEKIGYSYCEMEETGFSFPVIEVSVKYIRPCGSGDKLRVKAVLAEYENRLRIRYEIRNDQTNLVTTRGVSTQMAFNMRTNDSCFACPQILVNKVEALIKGDAK